MRKAFAAAAALLFAYAASAFAQAPASVRVIVPYAPGGSVDLLARLLGDEIGKSGGPSVIVEDKPGASTIVGTQAVFRAAPDGATVGMVANSFLINSAIRKLDYDPLTSFEPICHLVDSPQVLAVNVDSPIKTLDDLLAAARQRPGVMTLGALGPATTQHVAAETFKKFAGIDMVFVPYPGGAPAVNAIVGGQVDASIANYSEFQPFIAAGKLRPLAVMSPARVAPLPDTPTMREKGLAFDVIAWFAMVTTGGTPKPVVDALVGHFSAALKAPSVRDKLAQLQLTPVGNCGDGFAAFLRAQAAAIGPVVQAAGIKLE
jgi:tripartite-type tricarboxylate transporter receptor subunit TctC